MSIKPDDIDDVIHGRLRLAIMAYLTAVSPASFNELLERTGATNGNLSTHLRKLEEAGYVEQEKTYAERRPLTRVHLTKAGRKAWLAYLDQIRAMLESGQES